MLLFVPFVGDAEPNPSFWSCGWNTAAADLGGQRIHQRSNLKESLWGGGGTAATLRGHFYSPHPPEKLFFSQIRSGRIFFGEKKTKQENLSLRSSCFMLPVIPAADNTSTRRVSTPFDLSLFLFLLLLFGRDSRSPSRPSCPQSSSTGSRIAADVSTQSRHCVVSHVCECL